MSDALVIIPTYNEVENVELMLDTVMKVTSNYDILIVDDNSPDGTADIVKIKMAEFPNRVHILQRSGKLGLGTAYLRGFEWGLEREYQFFAEMDCDFSHNPSDLVRLREALVNGSDVAVGSRYIEGGGVQNWPKNRVWLSKGASIYARIITGLKVHDTTAGFVCYRREFLENLDFSKITMLGYAFQIQMKYSAQLLKYKIVEIPILFKDRELGTSKLSSNIITEAIFGVLKLRINSFFDSYQKK